MLPQQYDHRDQHRNLRGHPDGPKGGKRLEHKQDKRLAQQVMRNTRYAPEHGLTHAQQLLLILWAQGNNVGNLSQLTAPTPSLLEGPRRTQRETGPAASTSPAPVLPPAAVDSPVSGPGDQGNYVSNAMEWLRADVKRIENPQSPWGVNAAPIPHRQSAQTPLFYQTVEMPGRCTAEGEFAQNNFTITCAPNPDFTEFNVYFRWRERDNSDREWTAAGYPADGTQWGFAPPRSGFDPIGELRITVVPIGQPSPMDPMPLVETYAEPAGTGGTGPVPAPAGNQVFDAMMPHPARPHVDPPRLDAPKTSVDPVGQAGLARSLDGLAALAKDGARAFDFKKAGAALGRGGSAAGTLINLPALVNSITTDDINPIVVGTTSASTVSTALNSIESLAKLGGTPFLKKLSKFAGRLAGKAAVLADVGTLGNTVANQGKGSHPVNIVVDASAVLGGSVGLISGFGPIGFLITVPAIMYTFADVFLANPPLPDEYATHLKMTINESILHVDRQVKAHYKTERELITAEYEFLHAGLREQKRNDPMYPRNKGEYAAAENAFRRMREEKLATMDGLEEAALKDARGKVLTTLRDEACKWVRSHTGFSGTLAPTRSLDLFNFMRENGNWDLSRTVETDAYWKDYMLGTISAIILQARQHMDRIGSWAQTEFSDWPKQPKKHYASWFFGSMTYAESKGYARPGPLTS